MPKKRSYRGSKTGKAFLAREKQRKASVYSTSSQEEDDTSQEEGDTSQEEDVTSQEGGETSQEEGEFSQEEMDDDQLPADPSSNWRRTLTGKSYRAKNRAQTANRREKSRQQQGEPMSTDDDQSNQENENPPLIEYTSIAGQKKKIHAIDFDDKLKSIQIKKCANCHRTFPDLKLSANVCTVCKKDPAKLVPPNLVIGTIPPELQNLSLIEQMLIAQVHPVVQFHRIRNAQTGYKGNVISFVQDIGKCYSTLPLLPEEISNVIMFTKNTPKGEIQFKANRHKILEALRWLKANNEYYQHITISEANAARIPLDGDMVPVLEEYAIDMPDDAAEATTSRGPPVATESPETTETDETIEETFVPLLLPINQQRQVQKHLKLPYPSMSSKPVDEFKTDGYISKAFPCLFPTGKGDFKYPRQTKISPKEYLEFLLQYEDRRFIKDKRFCYFAMNTLLRHQALTTAGIAVKKSALNNDTVQTIREKMTTDPSFLRKVMAYAAKLRSTQQYWSQRCGELLDMVKQLGCPTIFFTLSAADYHWPDLFRLLLSLESDSRDPDDLSEKERRDFMHDNPDIVAYFLQKRCELFREKVLIPIFGVVDYWDRLVCVLHSMKIFD